MGAAARLGRIENGFGVVERAKITLAFSLPILAVGVALLVLWAAAAVVTTL
ncbi:MAG TPA: hypothetical protein VGW74_06105 [Propionibacteriaceae bacterium]|nr:hypothetical protein [Propionibacteriaceae bacterium]